MDDGVVLVNDRWGREDHVNHDHVVLGDFEDRVGLVEEGDGGVDMSFGPDHVVLEQLGPKPELCWAIVGGDEVVGAGPDMSPDRVR